MSLHPELPTSPYQTLLPEQRWFPADESLRASSAASSSPRNRSVFNRMVGEASAGGLELEFTAFLEGADDVQAHAKNYMAVGFKIDYVRANGCPFR